MVLSGGVNDEKGILYLLAGTKTPNRTVFGKHYRVLVPERGGQPTYVMPLSKTAFELPLRKPGPNGEATEALMVTHVLGDCPLESKIPVYVGTRIGIWRVDGDKISLADDRPMDKEP